MNWSATYKKYVLCDSYLTFSPYLIDVLLQWHRIDPVSEKEINRLDAIFSIQHNRNPFIEFPELVEYIWGEKKGQAVQLASLVRTTSDAYSVPFDTINPMAYPATDITTNSFTAHWKDQGRLDYLLDVFTISESGTNDTLIAMPGFKSDLIKGHSQIHWLLEDGTNAPYTLMDGSYAICSSTTTKKRIIQFDQLGSAPANTYLTVKCCVYKGDQTADLIVRGDNDQILYEQPLVLDEQFYTFAIPEGTTTISLIQKEIGTKAKGYHRISWQQAYLYSGDYQQTKHSIKGFPVNTESTSYTVEHSLPAAEPIYYQVIPQGLRPSNIICVEAENEVGFQQPIIPSAKQKILQNGNLYIIHNQHIYDVLGRKK